MNRTFTTILCAALIALSSLCALASQADPVSRPSPQDAKQGVVRKIINAAEMHYQRGEKAYTGGAYDVTRF